MPTPSAAFDLDRSCFPFEVTIYDRQETVLWHQRVEAAPVILNIPALPGKVGRVVFHLAMGEVIEQTVA